MGNLKYSCCFCAKGIKEKVAALIAVSNYEKPDTEQFTQQFFCHIPCFTSKLSSQVKRYEINLESD